MEIGMIEVELDIFSGRPNPTWQLSDADAKELAAHLLELSREAPVEHSSGLGFRGFILRFSNRTSAEISPPIRVFSGVVHKHDKSFVDVLEIERMLMRSAREHGLSALIDSIEQ